MKRFTKEEHSNSLEFTPVMKKPVVVGARMIGEPFEVVTMEGVHQGKAGDMLMRGVRGELYPCDRGIFEETYEILP